MKKKRKNKKYPNRWEYTMCYICKEIFKHPGWEKRLLCSFACNLIYLKGKVNEKNPLWKGDKVGYIALHAWVKKRLIKPKECDNCDRSIPLDLANISQKYKRDISDWEWLCRSCHMKKDGRMKNLKYQS